MQFKQYPSYKNSGVEWLGDVPEHWEVKKIKRISSVKRGASPRPINDLKYFDDNGEYAWVRISDVTRSNGFLFETEQRLSSLGASFSVKLEPESLFLSIAATVGKPCITKIKTCIHDGFVYFPKLNKHRDLLFNIFESKLCFVGLGKLGTQLNLNSETVEDIYVAIPPESEEKAILGYIQTETTRIDNLIAKQEKLIELLEEQRKSIISHAVTKGLNPNAPMKDSGVEWLGDVPEHWEVISIKFLAHCSSGQGINSLEVLDIADDKNSFPVIGGNGMMGWTSKSNYKEPVLSIGRVGALCGNVHLINYPSWISDNSLILKVYSKKVNLEILQYILLSRNLNNLASKSAQPLITGTQVKNEKITLPPPNEQSQILQYIIQNQSRINNLIAKQKTLIEKLKEYRASIISHAVTGKIDVREFGA
jgi:type I restriction enzyme S subunit